MTGSSAIGKGKAVYGMTLIELMVALAIGSFLMIGALTVFNESRITFRVNESVSRLQETARFVFAIMEPEVRMANFWGLRSRPYAIDGRAADDAPLSGVVSNDCDTDWAIDLDRAVEGSNEGYDWPACDPGPAGAAAMPDADTLVVRRVGIEAIAAPSLNTLYLQTTRGDAATLFIDGSPPAEIPPGFDPELSETHELVVNGFYVSSESLLSTPGNPVPSLRRKRLINTVSGPTIIDEEVLPGVEDLQIQFGIDTDPAGGPGRGDIDRYVDPDDSVFDSARGSFNPDTEILAVRVWARLRAERPEIGLPENFGYSYADQVIAPINDGFRRLVVSKTIYLRNARPPD